MSAWQDDIDPEELSARLLSNGVRRQPMSPEEEDDDEESSEEAFEESSGRFTSSLQRAGALGQVALPASLGEFARANPLTYTPPEEPMSYGDEYDDEFEGEGTTGGAGSPHLETAPGFGETARIGQPTSPPMFAAAQIGPQTLQFSVAIEIDGVPSALGKIGARASEAELVRKFGRAGTYVLTPIGMDGQPTRRQPLYKRIDEDHEILKQIRAGTDVGGVPTFTGGADPQVLDMLRAQLDRSNREMAELRREVARREEALAKERMDLANQRVTLLSMEADRSLEAQEKMLERQDGLAMGAIEREAARSEQLQEAQRRLQEETSRREEARQELLLAQIRADSEERSRRAERDFELQMSRMEKESQRQQKWMETQLAAERERLKAREAELKEEAKRRDAELKARQKEIEAANEREFARQTAYLQAMGQLQAQSAQAQTAEGSIEKLLATKKALEELGGGNDGPKGVAEIIADVIKEGLKTAQTFGGAIAGQGQDLDDETIELLSQQAAQQALTGQPAAFQLPGQTVPQITGPAPAGTAFPAPGVQQGGSGGAPPAAANAPGAFPFLGGQPAMNQPQGGQGGQGGVPSAPSAPASPAVLKSARRSMNAAAQQINMLPRAAWQPVILATLMQNGEAIKALVASVGSVRVALEQTSVRREAIPVILNGLRNEPRMAQHLAGLRLE